MPYSAYKLLRILSGFELPGATWAGWHMHSGKLWTPEGVGIEAHESVFWGLLVRQARGFRALYEEGRSAKAQRAKPVLLALRPPEPESEPSPMVITGSTSGLSPHETDSSDGYKEAA